MGVYINREKQWLAAFLLLSIGGVMYAFSEKENDIDDEGHVRHVVHFAQFKAKHPPSPPSSPPPSPSPRPPPPPPPTLDTWVLGKPLESCDAVCAKDGRVCDFHKLEHTDTQEHIEHAAHEANHECVGVRDWSYKVNPAVCTDEKKCCVGGHCVGVCAFGTGEPKSCSYSGDPTYSRLCACKSK